MIRTADQETGKVVHDSEEQDLARMLLRRLMAERNLRTTGIASLLGEESHTVRRMLNGSRAVTLGDIVLISRLGGFSLDEIFLGGARSHVSAPQSNPEENLSKVFSAIADLLGSSQAVSSVVPGPAAGPPQPFERAKRKQSTPSVSSGEKRGRGRPRKFPA